VPPATGPIPDYVVIGHVTHDLQADGTVLPGGTALYSGLAASRLGCRVGIVTAGPVAADVAACLPDALIHCQPGDHVTRFVNRYVDGRRTQYLLGRAPAIDLAAIPAAWWQAPVVHLGPLAREIDPTGLPDVTPHWLAATPQGWLRHWDDTGLVRLGPPANLAALADAPLRALVVSEGGEADIATPIVEQVLARGGLVVITQGARGSRLLHGDSEQHVPSFPVDELDPTGAGDVFAAALLVRLAAGDTPLVAATFASAAAALTVTGRGVAAVPDAAAVARLLASAAPGGG
jgi:hypothetical protein